MTTKTVRTEEGEVKYDTRECHHCGEDVLEERALGIGIDLEERPCNGASLRCEEVHPVPRANRVLCDVCCEALFDYERSFRRLLFVPAPRMTVKWGLLLMALGVGIVLVTGVLIGTAFGVF